MKITEVILETKTGTRISALYDEDNQVFDIEPTEVDEGLTLEELKELIKLLEPVEQLLNKS